MLSLAFTDGKENIVYTLFEGNEKEFMEPEGSIKSKSPLLGTSACFPQNKVLIYADRLIVSLK